MSRLSFRKFVALAALVPLAACNAPAAGLNNVPYDPAIVGEVDQLLLAAATHSVSALDTLAMIQRARTAPRASTLDESQLPEELRRKVTLEWSGPANEAVRKIASNIGYGFIEPGNPPAHPALVSIDLKDIGAAKALEDIGNQVFASATVIVNPNTKTVEFRNETAPGVGPAPDRVPAPAANRRRAPAHPATAAHRPPAGPAAHAPGPKPPGGPMTPPPAGNPATAPVAN